MTKGLFKKYLQGNCSEQEFEQFLLWIEKESSKTSGRILINEIWEEFEPEKEESQRVRYNQVLDKIHHRINISQNSQNLKRQKISLRNRILSTITRVAAILLLPVSLMLVYTNLPDKPYYAEKNKSNLEVEAPGGSKTSFELVDGTKVWLNHGSKLKFPHQFKGETRRVYLTGEAYFEVAHNSKIPFIVETNQIEVKATGTEFNVNAYPGDKIIETTLVKGKVILYEKTNNQKIKALDPNESLRYSIQANTYSIDTNNTEKYISWKDGLLIFKNDPIDYIGQKLSRWYNVDVIFTNKDVKQYTYTATFTDETLTQVLELMKLATPISYELIPKKKMTDGSYSKEKVLIGVKKR
tara:strand:+ start:15385 stop:16443 length:1059 start_codon:yes stop_codon:yes gene_type:complete